MLSSTGDGEDRAAAGGSGRGGGCEPRDPTSTGAGPTVVIVDDDPDLRLVLRLALGRGDEFRLAGEAADGPEAVEVVAAEQPDAILLDLRMPEMNGWEVLPHLREVSPGSMVVVWSALEPGFDPGDLTEWGAFAYLDKHTAVSCINDQLAELLRRFRAGDGPVGAPGPDSAADAEQAPGSPS